MEILYIKGDATAPIGSGVKVITHICNDIGGWGKGFVLALSKKWKMPEEAYRQWYKSQEEFTLGAVQFVNVENELYVANMIGQHGIYKDSKGLPPIRYDAVRQCLKEVYLLFCGTASRLHYIPAIPVTQAVFLKNDDIFFTFLSVFLFAFIVDLSRNLIQPSA